jgi:hypothetical protein
MQAIAYSSSITEYFYLQRIMALKLHARDCGVREDVVREYRQVLFLNGYLACWAIDLYKYDWEYLAVFRFVSPYDRAKISSVAYFCNRNRDGQQG